MSPTSTWMTSASPFGNRTLQNVTGTNDNMTDLLLPQVNHNGSVGTDNGNDDGSMVVHLTDWLYALYILIGAVGIVGNSFAALVMLGFTDMRRKLTNIYVINQSLIDLMTSIWLFTLSVFQDPYLPPGIAGELKCHLWLSKMPFWCSYINSSMNIVAITVERYLKVVHPIFHRNAFTKRRAKVSVALIWLFGYVYNGILMPTQDGVSDGECLIGVYFPSPAAKKVNIIAHFILQYLLPVVSFVFCYGQMALTLRRGVKQVHTAPLAGSSNNQSQLQEPPYQQKSLQLKPNPQPESATTKKGFTNVIKTMVIISFLFIVCLSLNQWLFLFFNLDMLNYNIFARPIYPISVISMYLTCCINPFIYATTYQQFRDAVKRLLPKSYPDWFTAFLTRFIAKSAAPKTPDVINDIRQMNIDSNEPSPQSGQLSKSTKLTHA